MGRDRLDTSRVSADLLVVEGTVSEASINTCVGEEDIIIVEKEKHRAKSTEKSVSRNHHCERNCGMDRKKLDCAILAHCTSRNNHCRSGVLLSDKTNKAIFHQTTVVVESNENTALAHRRATDCCRLN